MEDTFYYSRRRNTSHYLDTAEQYNLDNGGECKVIKPKHLYNVKNKTFLMDTD